MDWQSAPSYTIRLMISASAALFAFNSAFSAEEKKPTACNEDAMLVFDASGSMGGSVGLGVATPVTRIDKVRSALAEVLPSATRFRRVGLITYGPGPYQQCNVKLDLKPTPNAADLIMRAVNALTPAGRTPLTSAVAQAADVLDFRHKPSLIVVVTDGEETCGGSPCDLGKQLHAAAEQLTIHVIGYRPKGFSWTGEQSLVDAKCLADQNGGLYIAAETEDDLILALEKTLGCPMVTQQAYNATVCPLLALRRHSSGAVQCPLPGSFRTLGRGPHMSQNDPKQTLASSFRRHDKSWRGLGSLSASRNVYLPSGV